MPYLTLEEKEKSALLVDNFFHNLQNTGATPGKLNYLVTELCRSYIKLMGLNYTHLNDVVGALESAKLEFYRRMVSPYEEDKIKTNGDVYEEHSNSDAV